MTPEFFSQAFHNGSRRSMSFTSEEDEKNGQERTYFAKVLDSHRVSKYVDIVRRRQRCWKDLCAYEADADKSHTFQYSSRTP